MLGRWARKLKVPEMLKFLAVFFLIPGLFIIMAKTRFLVLFRGLQLPELKVDNFSGLSFR